MTEGASFLDRVIAHYASTVNENGYSEKGWAAAQAAADSVASLLEAKPPARILDLACGTGPSTAALALKGFEVTGLDCTPASIEIARRMSAQRGASVEWLCEDMRLLGYRDQFDYVCIRDVIFGIFESRQEDLDLIGRMARAVKPGGRCLFEVYNKQFALEYGVEGALFYDSELDRFVRKDAAQPGLTCRLYSHDEWERMLTDSGLRIIRMDGWKWADDPLPPPWRADLIVAEKSG